MQNRVRFGWRAACCAALAIIAIDPLGAAAQRIPAKRARVDTTVTRPPVDTATKRIKIRKEPSTVRSQGGEVSLPPKVDVQAAIDSALAVERSASSSREDYARETQRRLDSMETVMRVRRALDALRMEVAAARERERQDSAANAERASDEAAAALRRHLARGFYVGLAAGPSTPQRDLRNGYTGGWNTTLPVGWDASDSPLGVRADVAVDHLNGTRIHDVMENTTAMSGDITVWSINTDVKLRMRAPGTPSRTNAYLLGGIGAHRIANGVYGVTGANAGKDLNFSDARTRFGWNAGAGMSVEWGPAELFVESRFIQVKSDLPYHSSGGVGTYTSFLPVTIGLQWF